MSEQINSFKDLKVYAMAVELQQQIFQITQRFPREEVYSLTNQIRRSSRSVGSNIAEAWHKRRYETHFISKLSDADAEQAETQHWLDTSTKCGYVNSQEHKALLSKCEQIGRILGKMMSEPGKWCLRSRKGRIQGIRNLFLHHNPFCRKHLVQFVASKPFFTSLANTTPKSAII